MNTESSPPAGGWRRRFTLAACAFVCVTAGAAPSIAAQPERYAIDPVATRVEFAVKFLGFIPIHGHFTQSRGVFERDLAMQGGRVEVEIDTRSLEGGGETARGADFFDVERHPTMLFRSRRFVWVDGMLSAIEGELTLLGKTQPIALAVEGTVCNDATPASPAHCVADGVVRVSRRQFGMGAWRATVGDEVSIRIHLVATKGG